MIILGIETSCDETAAAVVVSKGNKIDVLSNIVSSQVNIHKKYGGVVPEVAAREHVLQILPVINEALKPLLPSGHPPLSFGYAQDKCKGRKIVPSIDVIAVATGPGLITSLLVGVETAKTLSYVWNIPVVSVNHIEGHIYANFVGLSSKFPPKRRAGKVQSSKLFPAVVLTVSGGHTMLVLMKGHGKYKTIGETRDDAAGEAFDKAAKLLGLTYPGGPEIAKYAEKFTKQNSKISNKIQNSKFKIKLPRPMINNKNYDFSFSGLKTALMYDLKKDKTWKKKIPEYSAEFQQAVIDVLISKTIRAAKEYKAKTVMLTGGVAANKELRKQMEKAVNNIKFIMPDLKYTTDNAVMMAVAGYYKAKRKEFTNWQKLKVDCNLEL